MRKNDINRCLTTRWCNRCNVQLTHFLFLKKKIISLRVEMLAHKKRLTQPLFIEVSVQIQYRNDGMASNERRTIFLLGLPCVRY